MKKIAIIPARSGSKGLQDKNIMDLCGKPLLAYSIEAAKSSGIFDRIILSTDSMNYAEIGRAYGAEVIMRGEKESNDRATTYMVISDLFSKIEIKFDYFVLLQPTSPMRTQNHVLEACKVFEESYDKFDFLVSMKEAEHSGILVKPIAGDMSLKFFDTDFSNYRRQGYTDYSPNGAIFIGKTKEYLLRKHFFGERSRAYIMDKISSIDIDDVIDYELAKILMLQQKGN